MTSFIISCENKNRRKEQSLAVCQKFAVDPIDILTVEELSDKKTQGIGIETIKYIQKKLLFKPIKSKTKALIIENAELLTVEAQNALLKVLEEPPTSTIIVLETSQLESLLPTIQSRCQIISIMERKTIILTDEEEKLFVQHIDGLKTVSVGRSLSQAESLVKNKDAIIWMKKMIHVARKKLIEEIQQENNDINTINWYYKLITSLQKMHRTLGTTNVNQRLALEHMFLSFFEES